MQHPRVRNQIISRAQYYHRTLQRWGRGRGEWGSEAEVGGCEGGRRTSPAFGVFVADQFHLLARRRRLRSSRRACGAALHRHLDG